MSVVIPTYNRRNTIARAVRSVLNQTFSDFELIIVDDASQDDTAEIIEGFHDPRIAYIRHPVQKGGPAARNTGIASARAKFIAFQDSDDEWMASKLENQIKLLHAQNGNVGAIYTSFVRIKGNQATYIPRGSQIPHGDTLAALLWENFISTQTLLVAAELLCEIGGFDEFLPRYQDWDLVLRLSMKTQFAFIDEPLVMVYDTPQSISHNAHADIVARLHIVQKLDRLGCLNKDHRAWHNFQLARSATRMRALREAKGFAWNAVRLRPSVGRYWAALLLPFLGSELNRWVEQR